MKRTLLMAIWAASCFLAACASNTETNINTISTSKSSTAISKPEPQSGLRQQSIDSTENKALVSEDAQSPRYYLIPPVDSDVVGLFVEERPQYSQIIGYSAFGHVFLYAPENQENVVFYPYQQAGKSYGSFDSIEEFEEFILKDEFFASYILKEDFLKQLVDSYGPLEDEEVFIPTPYFDYDSEDTNTFNKGNIWAMLALTNQFFNE